MLRWLSFQPSSTTLYTTLSLTFLLQHLLYSTSTVVQARTTPKSNDVVPHGYIVEFDGQQVNAANYKQTLDDFYNHLRNDKGLIVTPQIEYDVPELFLGAAFKARPASESEVQASEKKKGRSNASLLETMMRSMQTIQSVPVVAKVHTDKKIRLDQRDGKRLRRQSRDQTQGFDFRPAVKIEA